MLLATCVRQGTRREGQSRILDELGNRRLRWCATRRLFARQVKAVPNINVKGGRNHSKFRSGFSDWPLEVRLTNISGVPTRSHYWDHFLALSTRFARYRGTRETAMRSRRPVLASFHVIIDTQLCVITVRAGLSNIVFSKPGDT